jgi:hypothetical protein
MKPALLLFVLAPLVGEYLLGNLTLAQFSLFPIMMLLYGAGAIVVREITRRWHRGWPTLLLMALAYGVLEEGIATQSLFNPNYVGLRLLDYGFIPSLGIGLPWTIYVLMLHTVWSISVPVLVVEAIFGEKREQPWLGKVGLAVFALLFTLGITAVRVFSAKKEKFMASPAQTIWTVIVIAGLVAIAFGIFRRRPEEAAKTNPEPDAGMVSRRCWLLGLVVFLTGSFIHVCYLFGTKLLPQLPFVAVAVMLGLFAVVGAVVRATWKSGWNIAYTHALGFGALFVYCWWGVFFAWRVHGAASVPGQFVPLTIVLLIVAWYFWRQRQQTRSLP